jgi:hypothetical protein
MIVRILTEGQYTVPDGHLVALNVHDDALAAAVAAGDETAFHAALDALLAQVRSAGEPLPVDELVPSDVILPSASATIEEVRELSADDGLVPG